MSRREPQPRPASQSNQEAGTTVRAFTTPGRQQFHPSSPKAWVIIVDSSAVGNVISVPAVGAGYNVSSITDLAPGQYRVNFSKHFSSSLYGYALTSEHNAGTDAYRAFLASDSPPTSATFDIDVLNNGNVLDDPKYVGAVFLGDQS